MHRFFPQFSFRSFFLIRSQKRKPFSADYLYHIKKGLFLYSLFQTVEILIPWFRFVVFFLFLGWRGSLFFWACSIFLIIPFFCTVCALHITLHFFVICGILFFPVVIRICCRFFRCTPELLRMRLFFLDPFHRISGSHNPVPHVLLPLSLQ